MAQDPKIAGRVNVYGNYNQQCLVCAELASLFSSKVPSVRVPVEIQENSYLFLQGNYRKLIERNLQELFPGTKLYFHQSREQTYYAILFINESGDKILLEKIYRKLEADLLSQLEIEVMGPEYWNHRDKLKEFLLSN